MPKWFYEQASHQLLLQRVPDQAKICQHDKAGCLTLSWERNLLALVWGSALAWERSTTFQIVYIRPLTPCERVWVCPRDSLKNLRRSLHVQRGTALHVSIDRLVTFGWENRPWPFEHADRERLFSAQTSASWCLKMTWSRGEEERQGRTKSHTYITLIKICWLLGELERPLNSKKRIKHIFPLHLYIIILYMLFPPQIFNNTEKSCI